MVLLNRRTAWLAIVVGLAVIMVRRRRLSRRVVAMVAGAVLLTIAGYVALGGSEGEEQICRDVGGRHGHARMAHPRMV